MNGCPPGRLRAGLPCRANTWTSSRWITLTRVILVLFCGNGGRFLDYCSCKNAILIQPRKDTRPQECHLVPIKLQIHNSTGKSPVIYWLSAIKIQVLDVSGLRLISWMQSSGTLWKDRSMSTTAPDFLRAARILRNVTRHSAKAWPEIESGCRKDGFSYWKPPKWIVTDSDRLKLKITMQ